MATSTAQRVGIWVIAVAMTVGTVAGFIAMILAPKNEAADQKKVEAAFAQYQKDQQEYQKKMDAQAAELSEKYYSQFAKYKTHPAKFDKDGVTKLTTKDLKAGTGKRLGKDTSYHAYYIGWLPSGKVFDQSFDGDKLKNPIPGGGLIEGWNEGVIGMKMGGVRLLTIPADKAYGEAGSGEDIPSNTPLRFIVMVIPPVEEIPAPEFPEELLQ